LTASGLERTGSKQAPQKHQSCQVYNWSPGVSELGADDARPAWEYPQSLVLRYLEAGRNTIFYNLILLLGYTAQIEASAAPASKKRNLAAGSPAIPGMGPEPWSKP
jgi:hypothetical protein